MNVWQEAWPERNCSLAGDKLELEKCDSSTGVWEVRADGQVKQGNMCLAVDGSAVHALDCDEAASLGASNFFQVAVPAYDPKAVVAVRSLGELLRGSLARQGKLLKELQALLPKLATCKAKISLASLPNRASGLQAAAGGSYPLLRAMP